MTPLEVCEATQWSRPSASEAEFGAAFPVIADVGDGPFLRRWPVAGTSM